MEAGIGRRPAYFPDGSQHFVGAGRSAHAHRLGAVSACTSSSLEHRQHDDSCRRMPSADRSDGIEAAHVPQLQSMSVTSGFVSRMWRPPVLLRRRNPQTYVVLPSDDGNALEDHRVVVHVQRECAFAMPAASNGATNHLGSLPRRTHQPEPPPSAPRAPLIVARPQ